MKKGNVCENWQNQEQRKTGGQGKKDEEGEEGEEEDVKHKKAVLHICNAGKR